MNNVAQVPDKRKKQIHFHLWLAETIEALGNIQSQKNGLSSGFYSIINTRCSKQPKELGFWFYILRHRYHKIFVVQNTIESVMLLLSVHKKLIYINLCFRHNIDILIK